MDNDIEKGKLDSVLNKFIKKDRLSTYLEKFLEYTHGFFNNLEDMSFDEEDYVELMFLLEEAERAKDKKRVNLVINNVVRGVEDLKEQLFILEKILLDSLSTNVPEPVAAAVEDGNAASISYLDVDTDETDPIEKSESSEEGSKEAEARRFVSEVFDEFSKEDDDHVDRLQEDPETR
jgi:hypothetical protein